MQMFYSKPYAGLSIRVDATKETVPGENMTVELWVNCTSDSVHVDYFNFSIYGFRNGTDKTFLAVENIMNNISLTYNNATEYNLSVQVPVDVWGATFVKLVFKYTIVDWSSPEHDVSVAVTHVRNTYLENIASSLSNLTASYQNLSERYQQLSGNYSELQQSYQDLNNSYRQLNQTYSELQQKYSVLEGSANELDNTRRVVAILVVTTVFFVATTLYLVLRKPKDYW
jgi:prefoldin subunit 5